MHTHYYCTVSNVFHAVTNDQQTLIQFIDILDTQLVNMPFIIPQIVYATRLRSGLFVLVILTPVLPATDTSIAGSMWDSLVLLKDKELFPQLTSEHASLSM